MCCVNLAAAVGATQPFIHAPLHLPTLLLLTAAAPQPELERLRAEAGRVTIIRDDWGMAHVHGHTDADAVFGMIYAQAEDDFPRIEATRSRRRPSARPSSSSSHGDVRAGPRDAPDVVALRDGRPSAGIAWFEEIGAQIGRNCPGVGTDGRPGRGGTGSSGQVR